MGGAVSAGRDNDDLVDNLISSNYIRTPQVERVFRLVDRADYMMLTEPGEPYKDLAWRNGHIHLSAPCIYSEVMESLELRKGLSFLNIGSGTGYLSTLVGLIIGSGGINHAVELLGPVIEYARKKLDKFVATSGVLDEADFCEPTFFCGNGLRIAPLVVGYDRLYCGAGCPEEYHKYLKNLIKVDGILVMPLKDNLLQIRRVATNKWRTRYLLNVSFTMLQLPDTNDKELLHLDPLTPTSLLYLCRSVIRCSMRNSILSQNPDLNEPPLRVNSAKRRCPRKICIPVDADSDDALNVLHDLDQADGADEMNALLNLVISLGSNRREGAQHSDSSDDASDDNSMPVQDSYSERSSDSDYDEELEDDTEANLGRNVLMFLRGRNRHDSVSDHSDNDETVNDISDEAANANTDRDQAISNRDQAVNDDILRDEPVNDHIVRDEPVNDHIVRDEPVNDHIVRNEPVNENTDRNQADSDGNKDENTVNSHTNGDQAVDDCTNSDQIAKADNDKDQAVNELNVRDEPVNDHTDRDQADSDGNKDDSTVNSHAEFNQAVDDRTDCDQTAKNENDRDQPVNDQIDRNEPVNAHSDPDQASNDRNKTDIDRATVNNQTSGDQAVIDRSDRGQTAKGNDDSNRDDDGTDNKDSNRIPTRQDESWNTPSTSKDTEDTKPTPGTSTNESNKETSPEKPQETDPTSWLRRYRMNVAARKNMKPSGSSDAKIDGDPSEEPSTSDMDWDDFEKELERSGSHYFADKNEATSEKDLPSKRKPVRCTQESELDDESSLSDSSRTPPSDESSDTRHDRDALKAENASRAVRRRRRAKRRRLNGPSGFSRHELNERRFASHRRSQMVLEMKQRLRQLPLPHEIKRYINFYRLFYI